MFGPLGIPELIFIFALALLIFGPRELPKIGRTIGKAMAEFRKASNELRRTLNTEMIEEELRQSDPRRVLEEAASDLKNSVEKAGTAEPAPENSPSAATKAPADRSPEAAETLPEVRSPVGQLARGDLPTAEQEGTSTSPAESAVDPNEATKDS